MCWDQSSRVKRAKLQNVRCLSLMSVRGEFAQGWWTTCFHACGVLELMCSPHTDPDSQDFAQLDLFDRVCIVFGFQ